MMFPVGDGAVTRQRARALARGYLATNTRSRSSPRTPDSRSSRSSTNRNTSGASQSVRRAASRADRKRSSTSPGTTSTAETTKRREHQRKQRRLTSAKARIRPSGARSSGLPARPAPITTPRRSVSSLRATVLPPQAQGRDALPSSSSASTKRTGAATERSKSKTSKPLIGAAADDETISASISASRRLSTFDSAVPPQSPTAC